ncbi:MAG: translation initiation factor IF-3 [Clostridia bacterium]|nr:translation initiation factor IF-3 [Clostridia bacterium]
MENEVELFRSHRTAPRVRSINNHFCACYCTEWSRFAALFSFIGGACLIAKELLINDQIKIKEARMLDEQGNQLGIMPIAEARAYAFDHGVDLVLIAPQATPPVCRAMDYGKYRYECDKREKEAKKKQTTVEIKEVQLSCRIDTHDFETKVNRALRFLQEGNKVRVCLKFRGREMAHQSLGQEIMERFADACAEYGNVDKKPTMEGRQAIMFIAPIKHTPAK